MAATAFQSSAFQGTGFQIATAANAAFTEARDTIVADGTNRKGKLKALHAKFGKTEDADTLVGRIYNNQVAAALIKTEAGDTLKGDGGHNANFFAIEQGDSLASGVAAFQPSAFQSTAFQMATSAKATALIAAALSAVESGDTLAATVFAKSTASLSKTEAPDTLLGILNFDRVASFSKIEAGDTLVSAVSVHINATGNLDENDDDFLTADATVVGAVAIPTPVVGGGWSYKRRLRRNEVEEIRQRTLALERIAAKIYPPEAPPADEPEIPVAVGEAGHRAPEANTSYVAELLAALATKRTLPPATSVAPPVAEQAAISATNERLLLQAIHHFYGDDVEIVHVPYVAPQATSVAQNITPLARRAQEQAIIEAAIEFYYGEAA